MRLACRHSSPRAIRPRCVVFSFYSFQSVRRTDRASTETHMHAFTHVHAPSHTHLPPAHTFLILLASSYGRRFLFSPFSFLIICLLLPSLFQYPLSFSRLHMQSASPHSPHLPPSLSPSLHSPPSRAASPSISSPLSLQCVQSERPLSEPQRARTMEWRRVQ